MEPYRADDDGYTGDREAFAELEDVPAVVAAVLMFMSLFEALRVPNAPQPRAVRRAPYRAESITRWLAQRS